MTRQNAKTELVNDLHLLGRMNTILDSDKYTFEVTQIGHGVRIELSKEGVVAKKVFDLARAGNVESMEKHMRSLTETQAEQMFKGLK